MLRARLVFGRLTDFPPAGVLTDFLPGQKIRQTTKSSIDRAHLARETAGFAEKDATQPCGV